MSPKESLKETIRKMLHTHLDQGFEWDEAEHLVMSQTAELGVTWLVLIRKWIREIRDEEREVTH